MIDYFTLDRSWFEFWDFFNLLPSNSRTKSAIANNEEVAKLKADQVPVEELDRILEARASKRPQTQIPLEGYTLEIEMLNKVVDSVNMLTTTVMQALGNKNASFPPQPRPTTAFEKALEVRIKERERQELDDLEAAFGF